jgi:acyl-CoA thioesterase
MASPTFTDITAVTRVDESTFTADIDGSSFIVRGPNGGYLAALLVRALEARVTDLDGPSRAARSLTIHYPAAPSAGPSTITTEVIRVGRSLVTIEARLIQDGKPMAVAIAAFSPPWPAIDWSDAAPPDPPRWDAVPAPPEQPNPLPYFVHWDRRHTLGPVHFVASSPNAETGGWIRLTDGSPMDAAAIAAVTDAWPPAVFVRSDIPSPQPVPTVDLTVHFRNAFPTPDVGPGDPVFVRFRTHTARDGFIEEDGEVWSESGQLLAQSRQLAILLPG